MPRNTTPLSLSLMSILFLPASELDYDRSGYATPQPTTPPPRPSPRSPPSHRCNGCQLDGFDVVRQPE